MGLYVRKMDKKGIALKTIVGLIIGIVCVGLLGILAFKMYGLFVHGVNEQARASLSQISSEIRGLKEGEERDYVVLNPVGWSFMSYGNRLYLCDLSSVEFYNMEGTEKALQTCKEQNFFERFDEDIEIDYTCLYGKINSCFSLKDVPVNLVLKKENGVVSIFTKTQLIGENELENILDYQGSSSKTVLEWLYQYIEDREFETRKTAMDLVHAYFETIDSYEFIGVEEEKFVWQFIFYEGDYFGEDDEMDNLFFETFPNIPVSSSGSGSSEFLSKNRYDFEMNEKSYSVVIVYYDADKILTGGII